MTGTDRYDFLRNIWFRVSCISVSVFLLTKPVFESEEKSQPELRHALLCKLRRFFFSSLLFLSPDHFVFFEYGTHRYTAVSATLFWNKALSAETTNRQTSATPLIMSNNSARSDRQKGVRERGRRSLERMLNAQSTGLREPCKACGAVQCIAVLGGAVRCGAVRCGAVLCGALPNF